MYVVFLHTQQCPVHACLKIGSSLLLFLSHSNFKCQSICAYCKYAYTCLFILHFTWPWSIILLTCTGVRSCRLLHLQHCHLLRWTVPEWLRRSISRLIKHAKLLFFAGFLSCCPSLWYIHIWRRVAPEERRFTVVWKARLQASHTLHLLGSPDFNSCIHEYRNPFFFSAMSSGYFPASPKP